MELEQTIRQATGWGLDDKTLTMLGALKKNLEGSNIDKEIDVIGFSRGAVNAVAFANSIKKLKDKGVSPYSCVDKIRFMGLYDPVPGPNPLMAGKKLSSNIVDNTSIAYSLDEKRTVFKPTIYSGAGVTKLAFRGGHSDIGGGYEDRGLANITLEWMLGQGISAGAPFNYFKAPGIKFMARHQETAWFYGYKNRSNLGGITNHPSVKRMSKQYWNSGRDFSLGGVDLSKYLYTIDARSNDDTFSFLRKSQYQVGNHKF